MFTSSYTKSNVKNIREMLNFCWDVQDFMNPSKKEILIECVKGNKGDQEIDLWVTKFYKELEFLVKKIRDVQEFNSYQIRSEDISHLDEHLKKLTIDISVLEIFNNSKVKDSIDFVNGKINEVLSATDSLKSEIGQLKGLIGSSKEQAITDINEFLSTEGINYKFEIRDVSENVYTTVLRYISRTQDPIEVNDINSHLSWGERNAFAIVLFMHYDLARTLI